jgi:hypothetical protein
MSTDPHLQAGYALAYREARRGLEDQDTAFRLAAVLLVGEVLAWVLALITSS